MSGGGVHATGIASDLRGPAQLALAVSRALPHGHYKLGLAYRSRRLSRQITIH
jgi:hypothetical protein